MRKIFLLLVLFATLSYSGDSLYWSGATDHDANNAANYTLGVAGDVASSIDADDTIFGTATNAVVCSLSANLTVAQVKFKTTHTGAFKLGPFVLTCPLCTLDNGGAINGTGWIKTLSVGSSIYLKSATWTPLKPGSVENGFNSIGVQCSSRTIVSGNITNCILDSVIILNKNRGIKVTWNWPSAKSGALYTDIGATDTFDVKGNHFFYYYCDSGHYVPMPLTGQGTYSSSDFCDYIWYNDNSHSPGVDSTRVTIFDIPKFVFNGGSYHVKNGGYGTVIENHVGDTVEPLNNTYGNVFISAAIGKLHYYLGNGVLKSKYLSLFFYSSSISGIISFHSQGGKVEFLNTNFDNGADTIWFDSSAWMFSGKWTAKTLQVYYPGIPKAILRSTGSVSTLFTSANKNYPRVEFAKNTGVLDSLQGDTLKAAGVTFTSGKFKQKLSPIVSSDSIGILSTDSMFFNAPITDSGNIWIGATALPVWQAGCTVSVAKMNNITLNANTLGPVKMLANTTIKNSGTITLLSFGTDNGKITFQAGQAFTLTNSDSADLSGSTGAPDSMVSSTPGTRDSIYVKDQMKPLHHFYAMDQAFKDTITANNGTSRSGGNNRNYLTFGNTITVTPTSGVPGITVHIKNNGNPWTPTGSGGSLGGIALTSFTVRTVDSADAVLGTHASGLVAGTFYNSDLDSVTVANVFTYLSPNPVIDSLHPSHGSPAGGGIDSIYGSSLTSSSVRWNGSLITPLSNTDALVRVTIPAGTSGVVQIIDSTAQGRDTATYSYDTVPHLVSISPAFGNYRYAKTCSLTVTGGQRIDTVKVGDSLATINSKASALVVVHFPAYAAPCSLTVKSVATYGYKDSMVKAFSYLLQDTVPVVSSCTPTASPLAGGGVVRFDGTGMTHIDSIFFGTTLSLPDSATETHVWCLVPTHVAGTVNAITIARYGYRDTVSGFVYAAIYGQALSGRAKCGDTGSIVASWGLTGITHVHVGDSVSNVLAGASDTLVRFLWPCYSKGRYDVTADATGGTVTFSGGANYSRKSGGIFGLGLWIW